MAEQRRRNLALCGLLPYPPPQASLPPRPHPSDCRPAPPPTAGGAHCRPHAPEAAITPAPLPAGARPPRPDRQSMRTPRTWRRPRLLYAPIRCGRRCSRLHSDRAAPWAVQRRSGRGAQEIVALESSGARGVRPDCVQVADHSNTTISVCSALLRPDGTGRADGSGPGG